MNEHELKLHYILFGCPSIVVNGACKVIVLCVYAAHACSFNYESDYSYLIITVPLLHLPHCYSSFVVFSSVWNIVSITRRSTGGRQTEELPGSTLYTHVGKGTRVTHRSRRRMWNQVWIVGFLERGCHIKTGTLSQTEFQNIL